MIIVDDDIETCNSMASLFPWSQNGFSLVGKFTNGRSALSYLRQNSVDLIISDIKMPEMNGVELARRLKDQGRKEKIVFFSGYKDFEYARLAMEYGVKYYCLKPVTCSEIQEKLVQIRRELDQENGVPESPPVQEDNFAGTQLRKIRACIENNYRDITLNGLADYMEMNPSYLSRFFHEKTGEKLSEYITRTRMRKALELLQRDEYRTIGEVSDRVGYTNPVSFTKAFSKMYGFAPAAYRKNYEVKERHE